MQMYLNQAESVYSEDSSDSGMDESTGSSFGASMWNFGGRRKNGFQQASGGGRAAPKKNRTSQQVLATARAVANDMNHPNQDEVCICGNIALYIYFNCE
jgi:hypothetical protein